MLTKRKFNARYQLRLISRCNCNFMLVWLILDIIFFRYSDADAAGADSHQLPTRSESATDVIEALPSIARAEFAVANEGWTEVPSG